MREAAPTNVENVANAVKRATIKGGLLATAILGASSGLLGGAGTATPWAQPGAWRTGSICSNRYIRRFSSCCTPK
jgi:hypothetical protein